MEITQTRRIQLRVANRKHYQRNKKQEKIRTNNYRKNNLDKYVKYSRKQRFKDTGIKFSKNSKKIDNLGDYAKKGISGKKTGNWQGGRIIVDGYYYVYHATHPHKRLGNYVLEHRLIIEKKIGRYLFKDEIVHHKDRNKLNNALNNLVLLKNQSIHNQYHLKSRNKQGRFISEEVQP